jgi:hypothetical protein
MRRMIVVLVLGGSIAGSGTALAGTPGQTVDLGKSNGLTYHKGTFPDVVTQTGQPVDCPAGADVSGGGGDISGPVASTFLNESYPVAGEGWRVEGSSTSGARQLTGWAICDSNRSLEVAVSQTALQSNSYTYTTPSCPASTEAIGGGAGATGPGLEMIGARPSGGQWQIGARNFSNSDTLFDAYAVCGNANGLRYRESEPKKVPEEDTGQATARCKAGEAVAGGGFRAKANGLPAPVPAISLRPIDSGDGKRVPDDGWQVTILNDQVGEAKLFAIAACRG